MLATLLRWHWASFFTYLIAGLFIVAGNMIRDKSARSGQKVSSLIYKAVFVVGAHSVSDPWGYVLGLVARIVVVYQFVQLFLGRPLF